MSYDYTPYGHDCPRRTVCPWGVSPKRRFALSPQTGHATATDSFPQSYGGIPSTPADQLAVEVGSGPRRMTSRRRAGLSGLRNQASPHPPDVRSRHATLAQFAQPLGPLEQAGSAREGKVPFWSRCRLGTRFAKETLETGIAGFRRNLPREVCYVRA
jgi:hypothetical protein